MKKNRNYIAYFRLRVLAASLVFLGISLSIQIAGAAQVTLAWDPPDASEPSGYKVYYGTASRTYTNEVGPVKMTQYTVNIMEEDKTYYFAVTALYPDGTESGFSNEAVKYLPITNVDSDDDGIDDGKEINLYKTDPNHPDTDRDGLDDGEEISLYKTDPNHPDTDRDGLDDGEEISLYNTNPNRPDTDRDGLDDGEEISLYNTNPNRPDTDDDGIDDGDELQLWGINWDADNDQDGINNLLDGDSDGDDIPDGSEAVGLKEFVFSFDNDAESFTYSDDLFRGTTRPANASGTYTNTGGYSSGGLTVKLGGTDNNSILDGSSGGWIQTFEVGEMGAVRVSFRYRLIMTPQYEPDEHSHVLAAVDGDLIGTADKDYLLEFRGRDGDTSMQDSGWQTVTLQLNLTPGVHTLSVGAWNNKKDELLEITQAVFDDIVITTW